MAVGAGRLAARARIRAVGTGRRPRRAARRAARRERGRAVDRTGAVRVHTCPARPVLRGEGAADRAGARRASGTHLGVLASRRRPVRGDDGDPARGAALRAGRRRRRGRRRRLHLEESVVPDLLRGRSSVLAPVQVAQPCRATYRRPEGRGVRAAARGARRRPLAHQLAASTGTVEVTLVEQRSAPLLSTCFFFHYYCRHMLSQPLFFL